MERAATVQDAAAASGWSPRMLRYLEARDLVRPERSAAGYRLYGPAELERLRSLRALLDETGLELAEVASALRLRRDRALAAAVDEWLDGVPEAEGPALEALRWEQERSARLLRPGQGSRDTVKERAGAADAAAGPAEEPAPALHPEAGEPPA
ncbi:MerR-like DNA binding protein [Motilibacter rhizosphaerae]|uniref:MerR-like DNA binding protein n=1 Tax=Motilibacter rhizosphaerae TaxID=598652 RepID=A0A4Q7NSR4_9ACTN|nr:MerR family transcriptional regulator [Motilibacter rhizosphaerae]RZS90151.1 MerR-like DNA binding protein [Motilibacter rhizosphaerae]